jgi:glucokinase
MIYGGEQCTCGRKGCWETYASATALIRQTKAAMEKNPDSVMWQLTDGNIDRVSGRTAFDAMRKGDAAGKAVVDQYALYVACGITNVVNTFQPDVLCIGGGISHEGETLIAPIREDNEKQRYSKNVAKQTEIRAALLGNDAGIIGAACLYNLNN